MTSQKYKLEDELVETLPGPESMLYRPASRVTLAPTICPDPNDFGTLT